MRSTSLLSLSFFLLLSPQLIQSANILFYFGVSTYSHRIIVWPLVETLASRGHNVTFLSPYPSKAPNPNVTEFAPVELNKFMDSYLASGSEFLRDRFEGNSRFVWKFLPMLGVKSCELLFSLPEFNQWLAQSHFDLVMTDALYGECGLGLAHKWQARVAYYKTNTIFPWENDMFGLPVEASWIPDVTNNFDQGMTFWTRIINTAIPLLNYWYHTLIYQPALEDVLRKGLGIPEMPSLYDMIGNISLYLTNADYSTDYARAVPPMVVQVPGMITHGSEIKAMSKEISEFIDSAGNGFIYVSFGSAVQISKMDPAFQRIFFNAFGNSTLKFIWKYEGSKIPKEMPPNVYTANWMPQQAILSHPRCRGFITHGGLGSIHEALIFAVPVIVMPVFGDQDYNAERVARLGHGLSLEVTTITKDQLETAIRRLTEEASFKSRTDELSISFKDRQNNPLDTAVWWTEKILRSSDFELSLLRPIGRNQSWFVRRSLDTFLLMFLIVLSPFLLISTCLKCRSSKDSMSVKKSKKVVRTKKSN